MLTDFDERKKLVWEMDRVAMSESAYLVLEWPTFNHIQWDFVKGNESTPSARTTNARMKYVWLTCDAPTSGC